MSSHSATRPQAILGIDLGTREVKAGLVTLGPPMTFAGITYTIKKGRARDIRIGGKKISLLKTYRIAVTEALYGYPDESLRHAVAAGQLVSGRDVDFGPAFALALSGDSSSALAIVTRLEEQYPEDTCVHFSYSPALRALLAMSQGSPEKAIQLLTVSKAYEVAQTGVSNYARYGAMYPTYVRGLAYQQLHKPREAAAAFQRMLDHPGLLLADPIGPAARLQLARALSDSGETARAKSVYREFLALWKDADPDIPLLKQAKAEFARL